MIRLLILSAIALGLAFPISGQTTTAFTPEEAKQVKRWLISHPEVRPVSRRAFDKRSQTQQEHLLTDENTIFYEGRVRWHHIEAYQAGKRPDFLSEAAERVQHNSINDWVDAHESTIPILSRADFERHSEEEQAQLLSKNAFIYKGKRPTWEEIKVYESKY